MAQAHIAPRRRTSIAQHCQRRSALSCACAGLHDRPFRILAGGLGAQAREYVVASPLKWPFVLVWTSKVVCAMPHHKPGHECSCGTARVPSKPLCIACKVPVVIGALARSFCRVAGRYGSPIRAPAPPSVALAPWACHDIVGWCAAVMSVRLVVARAHVVGGALRPTPGSVCRPSVMTITCQGERWVKATAVSSTRASGTSYIVCVKV